MENERLAEIVEQLAHEPADRFTLDRVVTEAVESVPGCDMCSVFTLDGGTMAMPATTHDLAARVDQAQYDLGQGPCLAVLHDPAIVSIADTSRDERWPRWSRTAGELGVGSTLSVRLLTQPRFTASLNMFSRGVDGFDNEAIDLALVYARLATVAMGHAHEVSGLRAALDARLVIGTAEGVLIERFGLTSEQAFEVLRRRSNESNTKLREIARRVVEGTELRSGDSAQRPTP